MTDDEIDEGEQRCLIPEVDFMCGPTPTPTWFGLPL